MNNSDLFIFKTIIFIVRLLSVLLGHSDLPHSKPALYH